MIERFAGVLLLSLFLFDCVSQTANDCQGNLGANIFEAGDFGSGAENVLTVDPGIAPGYSYGRMPPPQDGLYVITNNTGAWSNIFPTWLPIQDNSTDPEGYMMVVNASYETGLFYDQLVEGLCENTLYEFSADIINIIAQAVPDHIKPNVSFLINGEVAFSTGEVPQDERWHSYGFTFTTDPGEFSVELSLRNNSPGGIGNDLALDNISFRPCGPEALILPVEVANICEDGKPLALEATINGDQFINPQVQWQESPDQGETWRDLPGETSTVFTHRNLQSGFYYYRYLLAGTPENLSNNRCRIISNVKVVHVMPKFFTVIDTLCEGLTFNNGLSTYDQTGVYVDSFISILGCDSIVTLDLTIVDDPAIVMTVDQTGISCHDASDGSIEITEIQGGSGPLSLLMNGMSVEERQFSDLGPGIYEYRISDRHGCTAATEVELRLPNEFIVDIGPDTTVDLGTLVNIIINPTEPVISYNWNNPDIPVCMRGCQSFEFLPTNTSTLRLQATSANGCIAEDSAHITVRVDKLVFIPNSFTPNGDGVNDLFMPLFKPNSVSTIENFAIFNRWGGVSYHQVNIPHDSFSFGWDGLGLDGKRMEPGVYTYVIRARYIGDQIENYSGQVILLR